MRWPPQPRNRACPSGTKRGRENAVGAALCGRPSPVAGRSLVHPAGFWNGLVRRTPTRTLCHGWSEPGAAVKWHRPEFCTAPGPSGPGGAKTRNHILCAGNFAERDRGIPRKRGVRGRTNWSRRELVPDSDVSLPRRSFGFFPIAGKETHPTGRNPLREMKPVPKPAGGSGDPPLQGNFGPRRCDGRRSHETAPVPSRNQIGLLKTP